MFDDGNFFNPIEIEGTQQISIDPVTKGATIVRSYIQDSRYYQHAGFFIGSLRDVKFPNAVLVSEQSSGIKDGFQQFARTFVEIPATRQEFEQIAFTYPGRSRAYFSNKTGQAIGWDKYGYAAPATHLVNARVEYSYSLTTFSIIEPTLITYQGQSVDFCGDVYVPVGEVDIGNGKSEDRWQRDGATTPYIAPGNYVVSVSITRYNGPIFERRIVRVP